MTKDYPSVKPEYLDAVAKARRKLLTLISDNDCAPLMFRLSWYSAITARFSPSFLYNGGLDIAVQMLEPVCEEFPILSYADVYQLAGVVAVELSGVLEVPFHPGREDKPQPLLVVCLPDATMVSDHPKQRYAQVFSEQMGLGNEDIVALSGVHPIIGCHPLTCLGSCHNAGPGFEGRWTGKLFDCFYFKDLLISYKMGLHQLKSEEASLVEKYAVDEKLFFNDFKKAHLKLSELGFEDAPYWKLIRKRVQANCFA